MRFMQNVLLVLGASALGLVSCVVFVFFLVLVLHTTRPGEDPSLDGGAAILFAFLGFWGGIFGAVVGQPSRQIAFHFDVARPVHHRSPVLCGQSDAGRSGSLSVGRP